MAHFAIFAPPMAGHVNPLVALGETLIDRGHKVSFVHRREAAYLVGNSRVGLLPLISSNGADAGDATAHKLARNVNPLAVGRTIRTVASWTDQLCCEAPALLERLNVSAVIADQMEPAGGIVAEALGLPYATIATALPIDRASDIPPIYVGWGYDPRPRGEWRNRGGYRVTDWMMRPLYRVIEQHVQRYGLKPRSRPDQCASPLLQLSQAVSRIDFPRHDLSPALHRVGPLRRDEASTAEILPGGDRPLLFCSFGSLQGDRLSLFQKIARAAAKLGVQLVIAHGGRLSSEQAARLPADVQARAFVPQRALLQHSRLAITHAGFNTVLDSLSAGVPMLALPMAFEQHATAARIRHAGVGLAFSPNSSTWRITAALDRLLRDPSFRNRAAGVAREIAGAGGVVRAADLIEQCLIQTSRRA